MAVFTKWGTGNSTFRGQQNVYDQVDYDGVVTDYSFSQNSNGSVTVSHPQFGTDTLHSIDGFWFVGSSTWISMEDALAQSPAPAPTPVPTPTPPIVDPVNPDVIFGTDGNDDLIGSNNNDQFYSGNGNDYINGNGGDYNQANFEGSIYEYSFYQNPNGSVSIVHPTYGTDTIVDIDGLWFGGDAQWYSVADALNIGGNAGPAPTPTPTPVPPSTDPFQLGTDGNDTLIGSDVDNIFLGSGGNDFIDGNGGAYNQANYFGSINDVSMTLNADGSITVDGAVSGTDTLIDIDGFWFEGEGQWYSTADALAAASGPIDPGPVDPGPVDPGPIDPGPVDPGPTGPSGGTFVNGVLTGTSGIDTLVGGTDASTFNLGMGVGDSVIGNSNADTLNVEGAVVEWTFFNNGDGSVTMTHPTWGSNIMTGIDSILFGRSGVTLSVADALAQTAGLPAFRLDADGVVNGTPFDDVMIGTGGFDNYYGGVGNDVYDGGGGFDQINYDGLRSDYAIVDNGDGTITISNDVFGVDTISNIEGIFFNGGANDIPVDGISVGQPEFIMVADLFGAA